LLSASHAALVEATVASRLRPASSAETGTWIRTVYVDSKALEFSERIARDPTRSRKLRIRSYHPSTVKDPSGEPYLWVEVKSRSGFVVRKHRFPAIAAEIPAILRGGALVFADPASDAARAQAQWRRVVAGRRLLPTVVVDYLRRSYEGPDGSLRMTFDSDLRGGRAAANYFTRGTLATDAIGMSQSLTDARVMEVKLYRGQDEPPWLSRLLSSLEPVQFSKSATALRELAVVETDEDRVIS
jgi:hypothetical protein